MRPAGCHAGAGVCNPIARGQPIMDCPPVAYQSALATALSSGRTRRRLPGRGRGFAPASRRC